MRKNGKRLRIPPRSADSVFVISKASAYWICLPRAKFFCNGPPFGIHLLITDGVGSAEPPHARGSFGTCSNCPTVQGSHS
jgi:hypothetical protein